MSNSLPSSPAAADQDDEWLSIDRFTYWRTKAQEDHTIVEVIEFFEYCTKFFREYNQYTINNRKQRTRHIKNKVSELKVRE